MQHQEAGLIRLSREDLNTPIYVKVNDDAPWPTDAVFFMLTGDGLFLCRNHEFFISSVPAPNPPSGLGQHRAFLKARYPKIPRRLLERAVGFFHAIYKQHGSEAGLLLVWDSQAKSMRLVCPDQVATVSRSWWGTHPIGLFYEIPDLGGDLLIGDLHSHGNESAYASFTDKKDEKDRAGIHVVVGRLGDIDLGGHPDLHLELVIDGARFSAAPELILEGYTGPCPQVPPAWLERVKVESYGTASGAHGGHDGSGVDDGHGQSGNNSPQCGNHGSWDPPPTTAEEQGDPDPDTGGAHRA